jgi:hypothetical protein
VAARAAAFSDPEVKAVLASAFVPVAENCSHLQRQQDAEGDLFRLIAEQGHYGGRFQPTDTRQGMYACAPDGALLASCNVHGADRLLPVLREALARWERPDAAAGEAAAAVAAEGATDRRYLRRPPEGGLVLRVWSRDLPRDAAQDARPDDWRRRAFNLDHAWFTAEEAAAMVPAEAAEGAEAAWPAALARRVARYHLIDNVRGEPPMWRPEECVDAAIQVRVAGVDGPRVRLAASGRARLRGSSRWVDDWSREARSSDRGTDASIEGTLEWDAAQRRFLRFDLLAVGTRWGATQYNSRHDDPGPAPIGWAFELAGGGGGALPGDATPPHGLWSDYFGGR